MGRGVFVEVGSGVNVAVGVKVVVGVNVAAGVGVCDGVLVVVGDEVTVGPSSWPGLQPDRIRLETKIPDTNIQIAITLFLVPIVASRAF